MPLNILKLRLWYARSVMALACLMFAFLANLYALTPLSGIDMFGVSVSGDAHSITFLRTGVGTLFVGLLLASVMGLVRPKLFLTCLTIIVIAMTIIVSLRLYGIAFDGMSEKNMSELQTESFSWLLFLSGWIAYPRHTAQTNTQHPG